MENVHHPNGRPTPLASRGFYLNFNSTESDRSTYIRSDTSGLDRRNYGISRIEETIIGWVSCHVRSGYTFNRCRPCACSGSSEID